MVGDKGSVNTCLGAFLSLVSLMFVCFYGYLKVMIMLEYSDTNLTFNTLEYYYNDTYTASGRLGFNVAFGIMDFSGILEAKEEPYYGTLSAGITQWSNST